MRVVTHRPVLRRPWATIEAVSFIEALLASPGPSVLTETGRHPDVMRAVFGESVTLGGHLLHPLGPA